MSPATHPATEFKDRKVGLVIFGLATVFIGVCCALLVPLMIVGSKLAANSPSPPPPTNLLPIAVLYGALAVVLVWLGVGSIMTWRWARALLVIWSWSWLIMGLISIGVMALMVPHFAAMIQSAQPPGQPPLPVAARTMIVLVPIAILGFLSLALPLIWGLFYSGENVKATCEARDSQARWTDRCPLPVLAVSLWLAFGTLSMMLMPAFHSAAPVFGMLLSGVAGSAFYFLLAIVWAYSAWALYRLDRRGWWTIFIALILFCVSNVITYSRHDLGEVYAMMGYPPAQIEQIQKLFSTGGSTMVWTSLVCTLPLLGFLLYIRKYFDVVARSDSRTD